MTTDLATTFADFRGPDRFALRRRIGAGSFGVVYEAFDRERERRVALKTLRDLTPEALYRFKREFRVLADITHPNLLRLFELFSGGDTWFFTMELVEGVHFLEWVVDQEAVGTSPPGAGASALPRSRAHPERLRAALEQLCGGIMALHAAGQLHRDIKPSNVLVSPAGRVVLLDFGLVTGVQSRGTDASTLQRLVGTAEYMAPEQAMDSPLSEASDWYSVGVMLYEALAGRLPFSGTFLGVLMEKQKRDPAPLASLVSGFPSDLGALCMELVRRQPEARPPGAEILRRVTLTSPRPHPAPAAAMPTSTPFVGRESELRALREAFEDLRKGRTVIAYVHGSSGMGKTAVVRRFLDRLRLEHLVVTLGGRCYERELVPYKAFDALIDALSKHLQRLSAHDIEVLLPRDTPALVQLFPVLSRVDAVSAVCRAVPAAQDPHDARRRGVGALRELLGRMCVRAPVVLWIDDLQWGDADSAAIFTELLRPPDPPPLLLIASYRTEDLDTSVLLQTLIAAAAEGGHLAAHTIALGPLPPLEALELARDLLQRQPALASGRGAEQTRAEAIVREARGNPYFLGELARFVWDERTSPRVEEVRLDQVIRTRVNQLPAAARDVLELVAVAGVPLPIAAIVRASQLGALPEDPIARLRSEQLLRARNLRDEDTVETYHDRVRESIVAALPPERTRDLHRRLAIALEPLGTADPEQLATHFREGGLHDRAGDFAVAAAERAAQALAFDRAARLYQLALELRAHQAPDVQALRRRLGDALALAGRNANAAEVYRAAADGARDTDALELRHRSAEQLLMGGRVDEGLREADVVLRSLGLRIARSPARAVLSFLTRRLYLNLRGFGFTPRPRAAVPAADLLRIDTCISLSRILGLMDTLRAGDFQTRGVLLALRCGEPQRVCHALGAEAAYSAFLGRRSRRRTGELYRRARALADEIGDPHTNAMTELAAGVAWFQEGRFRDAIRTLDGVHEQMRHGASSSVWEPLAAQLFAAMSCYYLGDLAEQAARAWPTIAQGDERGNRFITTTLRLWMAGTLLPLEDDCTGAREQIERAMRDWPGNAFHIQHYFELLARASVALAEGDAASALALVDARWPALRRSQLLWVENIRHTMLSLRARCCLALARDGGQAALLARALRDARRIRRDRMEWSLPLCHLTMAGAADLRGDADEAVAQLRLAIAGCDATAMALHGAVARWRLGLLLRGEEGRELERTARAWLGAAGVSTPWTAVELLAPGFA